MEIIKRSTASPEILFLDSVRGPQMTEEEKGIVISLFSKSSENIDIYIPEDVDEETFHIWIKSSIKIHSKLEFAQRKVKPIMGRMFLLVKKRQDLLESFGCDNFSHFMDSYVPKTFSISSPEAWSAYYIAREFPDISCNEFETIGLSNLKVIAKAIPNDPEYAKDNSVAENVLRRRRDLMKIVYDNGGMKSSILAEKIQELGVANKADVLQNKIVIKCDMQLIKAWGMFCSDPRIINHVGSPDPARVISAMMGECYAAWMAESLASHE